MTAISRITQAGRRAQKADVIGDRVPAVWRGTVERVRDVDAPSGLRAGVYVIVPRLTGDEVHGPVPWVGEQPAQDDQVLVAAIEGRMTDLIVLGRINMLGAV